MSDLPQPDPGSRMKPPYSWTQQPAPQPAPPKLRRSAFTHSQWRLAGCIAGGGVIAGSLLPWATLTTVFGQIDISGTQGDGKITLAIGIAIVVAFLTGLPWLRWLSAIAALLVSVADFLNVSGRIGEAETGYSAASTGYGLYLVVGAAILAVIAAFSLSRPE